MGDSRFHVHLPNLYPKQREVFYSPARIVVCEATTKAGKAQPLDAIVYTPSGPRAMGDIQVGDEVCTPYGTSRVAQIHPQGTREIYRITFSDGSQAECTEDHLWEVHADRRDNRRGFYARERAGQLTKARRKDRIGWPRVMPLSSLLKYSDKARRRMWVRVSDPVEFAPQDVEINPYLLGVLISEGGLTTTVVKFSSGDRHVVDEVRRAVPHGHTVRRSGEHDYHITAGHGSSALAVRGKTMAAMLRRAGLMGLGSHQKLIPDIYKYNSFGVRWAVLRGIMDGDGFVDRNGQPCIEQTSLRLAKDIEEVVESLGGSVLTSVKENAGYRGGDGKVVRCKTVYRQRISHPDSSMFFTLPRKLNRCRPKKKRMGRKFVSIEPSRFASAQCITLEDSRGLYLTNRMIVTHNSVGGIHWLFSDCLETDTPGRCMWVSPIKSQAATMFERCERFLSKAEPTRTLWSSNKTERRINLHKSSIFFVGSDEPDSLYGPDNRKVVIDEASRCKPQTWPAVRSTVTATKGQVRIIGNVRGRKNWAYTMARKAEAGERDYAYFKLTVHDAVAGGILDDKDVEDAKRDLPADVFRELYLAEATEDGSNPFGMQHIAACVGAMSDAEPVAFGVDLAKKVDWTVCIGLDAAGCVSAFDRWQGVDWSDAEERICTAIGSVPALVDETGLGGPVMDRLRRRGADVEGFTFTPRSKQELLSQLAVAIQQGRVRFPDGPIRAELELMEYEHTAGGVRYVSSGHDDCVMSLAMAVRKQDKAQNAPRASFALATAEVAPALPIDEFFKEKRRDPDWGFDD